MKRIPLTQGKYALIDNDMFGYLNQWKWYAHKSGFTYYAERHEENRKTIIMHRVIMKAKKGQISDHRNCDGLDNRRKNLRFATRSQNGQNQRINIKGSSKYKGVSWHKRDQIWRAKIKLHGRFIHLGNYHNETVAACVYDQMAIKLFGEFARLNFS